ncbi:MAG: DUF4153 domain-containing protein [Gemmobacter sp.]|nr:DUF4153 domain-containing protein [Gemmobacter sp.]
MTPQMQHRLEMGAIGVAAGLACHLLALVFDGDLLGARTGLALAALLSVFFTALLAMTGPLRPGRAALGAFGLALVVAGLLALASLRFDTAEELFESPIPFLSYLVLCFVPLPFVIAAVQGRWRDYALLFSAAWTIVIRYAAAWLFVGVVWLVIFLSDLLLSLVGIEALGDLVMLQPVALVVTGLALGLAIAVVDELADVVSPDLVLRLLRLLVLPVCIVLGLFLLVLPVAGIETVFSSISAAATLLTISALVATLVTAALDQSGAEQSRSPLILQPARVLALMLIVPSGLAVWAVWERVAQYGWTPDRVFAAVVAVLGLGYGVIYPGAVLLGRGWETRIRQGNIAMALALLAASALLLTPVLNPQAIAARSQQRFDDGRLTVERLDLAALEEWGRAGDSVRQALEDRAAQPGQQALADRLMASPSAPAADPDLTDERLRANLVARMPLRPAMMTARWQRMRCWRSFGPMNCTNGMICAAWRCRMAARAACWWRVISGPKPRATRRW